ncbi:MAG: FkbM family methyltransferase [Selenomonadaceae bacterium]|nr:FkbM family methyltransferase [Selenomonadaceae bacterium]MBR4384598.1 FkbM family methyltransferase [Selenomonadaceae bacterium]
MEKFIELIRDMHAECYETVLQKLFANKIRVALLSVVDVKNVIETAKNYRKQLNVTHFITLPEVMPEKTSDMDFELVSVYDAINQHLCPEYIFACNEIDVRFAAKKFPASKILYQERKNTKEIYDTFMSNLPALKKVYDSLIDEESKKTFRGYWLGNVSNQLAKIHHSKNPHYLTPGFIPEKGAVVIDVGAYDGGTCLRFTERGFKVYGFEMDKNLFGHAAKVAEENNFVVENVGLGSYKHTAKYLPLNYGSTHLDDDGSEIARIITLDSYVREKNIPRVDLIKLDVEGAELDVLKGAAVTISRFKPILLLSAYHKWDDFWTLMEFVKQLNPEYEFALRQYHVSIEDEPFAIDENFQRQPALLGLEPCFKNFNECVLLAR